METFYEAFLFYFEAINVNCFSVLKQLTLIASFFLSN